MGELVILSLPRALEANARAELRRCGSSFPTLLSIAVHTMAAGRPFPAPHSVPAPIEDPPQMVQRAIRCQPGLSAATRQLAAAVGGLPSGALLSLALHAYFHQSPLRRGVAASPVPTGRSVRMMVQIPRTLAYQLQVHAAALDVSRRALRSALLTRLLCGADAVPSPAIPRRPFQVPPDESTINAPLQVDESVQQRVGVLRRWLRLSSSALFRLSALSWLGVNPLVPIGDPERAVLDAADGSAGTGSGGGAAGSAGSASHAARSGAVERGLVRSLYATAQRSEANDHVWLSELKEAVAPTLPQDRWVALLFELHRTGHIDLAASTFPTSQGVCERAASEICGVRGSVRFHLLRRPSVARA